MNDKDTELLSRYLDGELPAAEAEALRQRLSAEPGLRKELERFEALDEELRRTLAREGHVPVHVAALLTRGDDTIVVMPQRNAQRWGLGMAAALLAGLAVLAGPAWLGSPGGNLLVPNIQESPAFSQILDKDASRATGWLPVEDGVDIRPVLTFASNGGTWCREFLASQADEAWRGVACRRGGDWDVELLVQTPGLAWENPGFHTASADSVDLVANFIENHSADIPLGLEEEAQLIDSGWQ